MALGLGGRVTGQTQRSSRDRSGSLPAIHYARPGLLDHGEHLGDNPALRRPSTPHPTYGLLSPTTPFGGLGIPPVPSVPPLPEKSPRRSFMAQLENESTSIIGKRKNTVSRELHVLEGQLVGLRLTVPLGEVDGGVGDVRRGAREVRGGVEEVGRGVGEERGGYGRRRESTGSVYSQDSISAETYHGFIFGDNDDDEGGGGSQQRGCLEMEGKKGLGSHYRRHTPTEQLIPPPTSPPPAPSIGSRTRAGRQGQGGVEPPSPTSPTPTRTIIAHINIIRKPAPARLRPVPSAQTVLRTPSPLSGRLKGPGPHLPDGHGDGDDTGSGGDGDRDRPVFSRVLSASPETTSAGEKEEEERKKAEEERKKAEEEDERKGMTSRWSYSSSDFSSDDEDNGENGDMEVSPVSVSPTRESLESGQDAKRVSAEERAQQDQQTSAQEPAPQHIETSISEPDNKRTEQLQSMEPLPPFTNLTTQLASLQASLNSLVSQATIVEIAMGEVRDAMIALRDGARETLVDTAFMMEEVERVEQHLGEVRRGMKGKGKEVVRGEEDNQEQGTKAEVIGEKGEVGGKDKGKKGDEDTLLGVGMQFVGDDY